MTRQLKMTNPRTLRNHSHSTPKSDQKTLLEHIQELRGRLFWAVLAFFAASAAAYPFFDQILAYLVKPLGNQQLYYLTPVGGFSFMIKVCLFAGAILALPVFIYHLFRYIQPAIGVVKGKIVFLYIFSSLILALCGVVMAYLISLPAALHFLTDFNLPQITAMLTADSYFSFVMTYLVVAAVLFQLPLIFLIINSITPLGPGSMMKKQRYVIVIAFILGAILSPTPDILNQVLLAGPIIIMYQLSIFLVMAHNRMRRGKKLAEVSKTEDNEPPKAKIRDALKQPASKSLPTANVAPRTQQTQSQIKPRKVISTDIVNTKNSPTLQKMYRKPAKVKVPKRDIQPRPRRMPVRSLDGFMIVDS